jgi:formate dehydrogenase major subunit
MALVNITIDGKQIAVQSGLTILDAAKEAGIDVPTLCHHPALEPIGACRMCLVEVEKQRALQPACSFRVSEGMVVHTESEKVVETRKFLLELLFSERNHYCMYCQMSGDCELQTLAYRYGLDSWLYQRPYPPLPVDATRQYFVMDHNRCVLCRRCIRMCGELVGNHTLGLGARGANSMIVADMDVPFGQSSCISCGNCLQVCPTGALMDRKSAYRGVEKELQHVKSSCAACSVGCGIQLLTRDNNLIRIEGDWDSTETKGLMCVAGRFEPLDEARRRAWTPMVKRDGRMWPATVDEALDVVAAKLKDGSVAAVTSSRVTNEALQLFAKAFAGAESVGSLTPVPGFMAEAEGSLLSLDESDFYVIVGTDLSVDHEVAGFAVRRNVTNRGARMIIVDDGANGMDNLAYKHLKADQVEEAIDLAKRAEIPTVIYGVGAGEVLPALREALSDKAQFLGLVPGSNGRGAVGAGLNGGFKIDGAKTVFVLAADDMVDGSVLDGVADNAFVVVQTSYESALTERADVILPCGIWAEKSGTFTNTEGRDVALVAALQPPTGIQSDEEILSSLAEKVG